MAKEEFVCMRINRIGQEQAAQRQDMSAFIQDNRAIEARMDQRFERMVGRMRSMTYELRRLRRFAVWTGIAAVGATAAVISLIRAFIYEEDVSVPAPPDKDNILSLDPGLGNFMTGVCTDGTTFIVDGRKIRSINQWYNKQKAERKSWLKDGRYWSKAITVITRKRTDRIRDFMHKAARRIVDIAIAHNCGTIVIGVNKGQKQNCNPGRVNNHNFVQIPYWQFRRILKDKCARAGFSTLNWRIIHIKSLGA